MPQSAFEPSKKYFCYVQPTFIVNYTLHLNFWKMGNMFMIIFLVIIYEMILSSLLYFIS